MKVVSTQTEGQREDRVAQDQRPGRVVDSDEGDELEKAGEHGDLRKHRDREDRQQEKRPAAETHPCQRVGGGDAEKQRQRHRQGRDEDRVQDVAREHARGQHVAVVAQVELGRPVVHLEERGARLEAGDDRVIERKDRNDDDQDDREVEGDVPEGPHCFCPPRSTLPSQM
jgi:hypothetical protein